MKPGDWICQECNALVFASKNSCFKCSAPKPEDAATRYAPY
jgi:ribosomal protein L40E